MGFFLVGGFLVLALSIWSLRIRDLEQRGDPKTPFLFGLLFSLLFLTIVLRAVSLGLAMDDAQRLGVGLVAGCFSASAILMLARAYYIRRASLGDA